MCNHALQEAESMLALLRAGDSADSIRSLIGHRDPYRRRVLVHFDLLVARYGVSGRRRGKRIQSKDVSETLKAHVAAKLREGWSHNRILRVLPVGPGVVLAISKQLNASHLKRGRGRRFSAEMVGQIRAAVRAGKRASELKREFGIDADTVQKFRVEIGDFQNRRCWRKLSEYEEAQAEGMLRSGMRWRDVAKTLGCALATIQRNVMYRKRRGRSNGERKAAPKHS
jgi:hypothetical protein